MVKVTTLATQETKLAWLPTKRCSSSSSISSESFSATERVVESRVIFTAAVCPPTQLLSELVTWGLPRTCLCAAEDASQDHGRENGAVGVEMPHAIDSEHNHVEGRHCVRRVCGAGLCREVGFGWWGEDLLAGQGLVGALKAEWVWWVCCSFLWGLQPVVGEVIIRKWWKINNTNFWTF